MPLLPPTTGTKGTLANSKYHLCASVAVPPPPAPPSLRPFLGLLRDLVVERFIIFYIDSVVTSWAIESVFGQVSSLMAIAHLGCVGNDRVVKDPESGDP